MPTAYTEVLFSKPETTFAEFAQRCARAFGAAIAMRDVSLDEPLREAAVQPYYLEAIESLGKKASRLCSMSPEEVEQRFQDAKSAAEERNAKLASNCEAGCRTIDAMIKSAEDWMPPTEAHRELKRFMVDQLRMSRPSSYAEAVPSGSSSDWWAAEIASVCEGLRRAVERWQKARQDAAEKNRWVADLKASLEVTP